MLAPPTALQLELEKEAKEAVAREKALVERNLEAEQRLADAMRKVRAGQDRGRGGWAPVTRPGRLLPPASEPHRLVTALCPALACAPLPRRRRPPRPRRWRRSGRPSLLLMPRHGSCSACWRRWVLGRLGWAHVGAVVVVGCVCSEGAACGWRRLEGEEWWSGAGAGAGGGALPGGWAALCWGNTHPPRRAAAPPAQHPAAAAAGAAAQTNKSLESERAFVQKLGAQAAATKAELQSALKSSADLASAKAAVEGDLAVRFGDSGGVCVCVERCGSVVADRGLQGAVGNAPPLPTPPRGERRTRRTVWLSWRR